ncbi:MAG: BPSS1780 family membrane protein [Georgfuchsia sp.]
MPARQGIVWVIAGYRLFRANPPLLTMLTFFYLMAFTLMLVLPAGIGGVLFPILQPLLALAIANGCRAIAATGRVGPPPDLLAGIRTRIKDMVKLGSLQLAGSVLVMLAMLALGIESDPEKPDELLQAMALAVALSSPLLLAFWFAPLLTGWHEVPPLKSVFFSFVACLRNWRAFVVYGFALAVITLLAATLAVFAVQISEGFGQIVAKVVEVLMVIVGLPIFLAGGYISYRDIFTETQITND